MEYTELCGKIEEKIAECREKYAKDRENPFWSHVRNSELERMEAFYERIQKEGLSTLRLSDLKERLAELEKEKKREEEYPSFDWYGEHYHYLVLEGQCDAYRSMIELLEENENEQEVTKSNEKQRTEQEGQHDS